VSREIEHVERPDILVADRDAGRAWLALVELARNHKVVRLRKGLPPRAASGGVGEKWYLEVRAFGRHFIGEGATPEGAVQWVANAVRQIHDRIVSEGDE
jgi:hypothetical protein